MGESEVAAAQWSTEPETRALRRLQTAMSEAEVALGRRMNLGHSELAAMTHLSTRAAPVGPGWLSQRLGVTPAAATELVDRLERAGHLERQRDTADRRRVHLIPTDRALDEVGTQLAPLLRALDRAVTRFGPEERAAIQQFLAELTTAYTDFAATDEKRPIDGERPIDGH